MSKPSLPFIDYAAVKAATNIKIILEHYGLLEKLRPYGEESLRGCCPIHHGTDDSQFSVTPSKNLWRCFSKTGCVSGGNHLDLVARLEDCTPHVAAWKMNEWFNLGQENATKPREPFRKNDSRPNTKPSNNLSQSQSPSEPAKASPTEKTSAKSIDPPKEESGVNEVLKFTLDNLDASHPYLTERGLTDATIAEFGVGYCAKGILAGRIAIPIHNAEGQIVANAGRWPGEPPEGKEKYRLPGKFKKTLELFNYHRAALEPDSTPLVIVEGFFGVMHLWQLGIRRVVALMGWHMSGRQEEMIAKLVVPESKIILALDNDEVGNEARPQMVSRLSGHCFVRAFRWPETMQQPDELSRDHVCLFDC